MMRRKITAWLLAGAMILAGSMQGAYTVSAEETTGITKTAPSTSGEEEKEVHVEGLTINGEKTIYLRSANGKMQYVQTNLSVTYSPENAAEKEKKIKLRVYAKSTKTGYKDAVSKASKTVTLK